MWACYKGRTEAAKLLLARGANSNVKGEVRYETLPLSIVLHVFVTLRSFNCFTTFL